MSAMAKSMNEENLKIIFGLKIKSFRTHLGLSLQELSKKTGMAVSYLSEIESGKKYPKPEKMIRLATALEVDYDKLVSTKVSKDLDPFAALINSHLVKRFPFHLFGISGSDILGLFKNKPENADAFLQTFLQIGRAYDMSLENFLFAALRTYISQHRNYFPELEKLADKYGRQIGISSEPPSFDQLRKILEDKHGYVIEQEKLAKDPELKAFRSILRGPGELSVNDSLLPSQKTFILAKEIGFLELNIKERPTTSSWIKVQSFEQLVNNFKAAYFGGALLLQRKRLEKDLQRLFAQDSWDNEAFTSLLDLYQVTPEMLLYRISQLLPGSFGLKNICYFRFIDGMTASSIELTKELNMTDTLISYGVGINEHHCRRQLPLRLLKQLRQKSAPIITGIQKVNFVKSGTNFLLLSLARPLSLAKTRGAAIALGIKIDNNSRSLIQFIDDPAIVQEDVSESCERCPLTDCSERVAEATLIGREKAVEKREAALQRFLKE